jgi:hypothetical protein
MKLCVINSIFLLSVYQIAVAQEMMLEAMMAMFSMHWQLIFRNLDIIF